MTPLFTDPFFFGKSWSATDYLIIGVYAVFSVLIFASYFLRAIPPFKQIWWFVKWLLVMMLIKLGINFLKKEVKEWWEKK
jgi:cadmium resistance protein CadD (predicted permease)